MKSIIVIIFILCYVGIVFEEKLKINKTAFAILAGVLCWAVYFMSTPDTVLTNNELNEHLSSVTSILFFLMGAMSIIELVDMHHGFQTITSRITSRNKVKLLWMISLITFFMSSILDNLTTTIVMASLLRKIIHTKEDLKFYGGMVVIAANAGGAWTPIGDVTTTMLWIGGQITSFNIMRTLFIPSLLSLVIPVFFVSRKLKGNFAEHAVEKADEILNDLDRRIIFGVGMAVLIAVPLFKSITGLPPFMGMLFGLAILWVTVELIHREIPEEVSSKYSVLKALQKVDSSSIFFFLGILMAVACLESTGQLEQLSTYLTKTIGNYDVVVLVTGVMSSIVDNVPLVAAAQGMYHLTPADPALMVSGVQYFPVDDQLWEFLAYAVGTGGSLLIIGSAAGVAMMGMLKIEFMWYLKKISLWALIGYAVGAAVYLLIS